MATNIKTLIDADGNYILPRTRTTAITLADGVTSLDSVVSGLVSPEVAAADVDISDVGGYYTSTNTEGALQEIGDALANLSADAVDIVIADTGSYFTGANVEDALQEIGNTLANLSADAVDIIVTPAGNIESTNVQDALEELDTALGNINLTAGAISNTPAGNISSTNVQAAINELDTEKAPLSSPTFTGNTQINSLGVGTTASGTAGEIRATNNITAYYSDERLKDFHGTIPNALDKVLNLNGYLFTENQKAKELGYSNDRMQVGVSAQEIQAVLPEAVTEAPIGGDYLTVWYEKLVPLLIEAIKEQQKQIEELKGLVK